MSSLGSPGESFDDDSRRVNPLPQRNKTIAINGTKVQVTLSLSVFQKSAWGNIQTEHFSNDEEAQQLLERSDNDLLASVEVAEHFYEIINHLKSRFDNVEAKLWRRFLLAGPQVQSEVENSQVLSDRVDLAYANILFSAACLCEADASPENHLRYERLRETAFISCSHSLIALGESYDFINSTGALPSILLENKLGELSRESEGSLRLQSALSELIKYFDIAFENFERLKKENGVLADHLYNLSAEAIIDTQQTIRRNHQLLRSIQEIITTDVTPEIWCSGDEMTQNLACPNGGHLSCQPDLIYSDKDLRAAALGIIRELSRKVEHIALVGKEWIAQFVSNDPEKRSEVQIANFINFWFKDTGPEADSSLVDELRIPAISEQIENAYTFFGYLRNDQNTGTATVQFLVDQNVQNTFSDGTTILIVGSNAYEKFFKTKHTSLFLTTTKSENSIDLSENLTDDLGNIYLPVAAAAVANQYRCCGPWKSGYIPRSVVYKIQTETKWTVPDIKLTNFFRTTNLAAGQDPADSFHDHYIFIHKNEKERHKVSKPKRPTKLVNT